MTRSAFVLFALTLSISAFGSGGFFGGGGGGDVTSGSTLTDNRIIRADGGAKGIQDSLWEIDDSGHMLATTDGSFDIGSPDGGTTQNRPAHIYVQDYIQVGDSSLFAAGAFSFPGTVLFGTSSELYGFFGSSDTGAIGLLFGAIFNSAATDFAAFNVPLAAAVLPGHNREDIFVLERSPSDGGGARRIRFIVDDGDAGGIELAVTKHPDEPALNGGPLLNARLVEYFKQSSFIGARAATHLDLEASTDGDFYKVNFSGTGTRMLDADLAIPLMIAQFDALGDIEASSSITNAEMELAADLATENHQTAINANRASATGSIGAHSDVDVTTVSPVLNDSLNFNGTNWVPVAGGGGGESNTSSNSGLGGISIVLPKFGIDLPFKSINAASSKILVTDDAVNSEVDIDVDETAVNHNNLFNFDIAQHREIDDSASGITDLLSASEIILRLAGKASTSHASTHNDGGSDATDVELQGGISTVGEVNYTPSIAQAGCDATDQLCAHLEGIDNALAIALGLHADTHLFGGTDEMDGDKLGVTFVPEFYTRDFTTPVEADNLEDLTAHLQGIDTFFGIIAEDVARGSITTTDGTATLISTAAIIVGQGETIFYEQKCSAVRTDVVAGDKGYGAYFAGNFRRPVGGSAVAIGTITTIHEKMDGPQQFSSDVDLTGNVLTPEVSGAASQDVNWECNVIVNRTS